MTLPPRSEDFMDDLFGAMQPDAPVEDDFAREDAAVAAVLARMGVDGRAPVPMATPAPPPAPRPRSAGRTAVYSALAAALVLGVFLGRSLSPDTGPVATVGVAPAPVEAVVMTPPARAEPSDAVPVASEPGEPEPPAPIAVAVVTPPPVEAPSAEAPARVLLTAAAPSPGLEVTADSRLFLAGTLGELEGGWVTFTRRDGVVPVIDRVRFPALGLSALPVGTVFHAAARGNLALVTVAEGEVHLVQDDGTRLGSVRAGESVAIGPDDGGLRMVATEGTDAAGLTVLLPESTVSEATLQGDLVTQRLRSLSSDVIRDLRGLETLDE